MNFLGYLESSRRHEVLTINSWIRNLAHSKYVISEVAAKGRGASRAMWDERAFYWMGGGCCCTQCRIYTARTRKSVPRHCQIHQKEKK